MLTGVKEAQDLAYGSISVIMRECEKAASVHREMAKRWSRVYMAIGLPAAVLAAIAGVSALISTAGRIPAGIIAILSAGLGSAAAFLDSQGRQQKHERLAMEFEALRLECIGYAGFELFDEEWLKTHFPQEIVRLRKKCASLLKDRPLQTE
jgi:hypothetical protein